MSTNASTEAGIAAAAVLDALVAAMIHERRMRDLWSDDYDRDRHIAMPLLHELGRTAPGDGWETEAGSIRIATRSGAKDWQRAYEELCATVSDVVTMRPSGDDLPLPLWKRLERLAAALLVPVPHAADSAPYLVLREAREVPDVIANARRAGALEVLRRVDDEAVAPDARAWLAEIADEYGGWPEGETE